MHVGREKEKEEKDGESETSAVSIFKYSHKVMNNSRVSRVNNSRVSETFLNLQVSCYTRSKSLDLLLKIVTTSVLQFQSTSLGKACPGSTNTPQATSNQQQITEPLTHLPKTHVPFRLCKCSWTTVLPGIMPLPQVSRTSTQERLAVSGAPAACPVSRVFHSWPVLL